jgi:predicted HTH transcriptional regulator
MIAGEEGFHVEYKESPDAIDAEDLVAFANSADGGTILAGVQENRGRGRQYGIVVGCDIGERTKRTLLDKAQNCMPPLSIGVTSEGGVRTAILRIDIQSASRRPCCTSGGTYKIRRGSTKRAIDPELMTTLILEREQEEFLRRFREASQGVLDRIAALESNLELAISEATSAAESAESAATDAQAAAEH